ncbi:MAG: amino acid adenylation domain-containing protein [Planctomycetota bacterium]
MSLHQAVEASALSPVQRAQARWCGEHAVDAVARVRLEATGALDRERLERALRALRERHELLAIRVLRLPEVEEPVQLVGEAHADVRWDGDPRSDAPTAERCARVRVAPLSDASGTQRAHVELELPWLLADRATLLGLADELVTAYETAHGAFEEDVAQFLDVAAWQEELLESEEAAEARRFWSGAEPDARAAAPSTGKTMARSLDRACVESLEAWARRCGLTVDACLRAALSALLQRRAGAPVPVALRSDGRDAPELVGVAGPLDRWVPIPSSAPAEPDAERFSAHVRRLAAEADEARRWIDGFEGTGREAAPLGPFAAAFSALPAKRGIVAAARTAAGVRFAFGGLERGPLPAGIVLEAEIAPGGIDLAWTAESAELAELADGFEALLVSAVTDDPPLDALVLAKPDGRSLSTASSPPPASIELLPQRFQARVAEDPQALALVDETRRFSRDELDRAARAVAAALRAAGVGRGDNVGIALPRSGAVIAGFLGTWRAGAAFVPLDPALPAAALASRVEEGALAAVLVGGDSPPALPAETPRVVVDLAQPSDEAAPDDATEQPAATDLAYGIFTSGSTGHPKLVGVEHGALASYAAAAESRLELEPGLAYATVSSFASDLGHTAIFPALARGGALHVVGSERAMDPDALAERFRAAPVDVLKIVPSHLAALLSGRDPAAVLPRRVLVLGGERLEPALVDRVRELAPELRIVNHYGPTESTVGVLTHAIHASEVPPLGTPLPGVTVEVVDGAGRVVPRGVPGELWVGGAQLARGYVGRDERTAERFIQAARDNASQRRYRTGDRARMDAEGRVHFLGRVDEQLKIRGLRIEPGEIEGALLRHPDVRGAAVRAFGPRLVGYAVGEASPDALLGWLAEQLPAALVPERIVALEHLPLTTNGKLDRTALPAPEPDSSAGPHVEPEGDDERRLAAVFGEILGHERVSATASFFELGGHSLLATRAVSRIREEFAVELPLTALFEEPTVRGLVARLALAPGAELPPLERAPRDGPLPVSFAQRRMWLLDRLEPEGRAAYAIPMAARVQGPLDVAALTASVEELVRRHETLRTVFHAGAGGEPVQIVQPEASSARVALERVDLSDAPLEGREQAVVRALRERALAPFDLAEGPLLRMTLVELGYDEHVLFAVCHHVVFDAWSRGVLLAELTALYGAFARGAPSPLAPLEMQYADFAAWQRGWLAGARREAELEHWRRTLAGAPGLLQLPSDRPRPSRPTHRGDRLRIRVPASTGAALNALAKAEGATLFMVLLGAFDVLLARLTGQDDIVVGSPISNRRRPELERLIGFFSNTIVLRTDLSGEPTFRALLGRVRTAALDAYAHQDLPFEELVEALPVERDLSANPLFQVLFTLRNTPRGAIAFDGLRFEPVDAEAPTAKLDLTVLFEETEEGLVGSFEYATDLFEHATIEGWRDAYVALLDAIAANPDAGIEDLPLGLPPSILPAPDAAAERGGLAGATLVDRLAAVASARPEARAVGPDAEGGFLSYVELDRRANQLAQALVEHGVRPEERVGLAAERGALEWVAMLAVWKAGAAYVPLDPSFPEERLAWVVATSDVRLALTVGPRAAEALPASVTTIALDDPASFASSAEPPPAAGDADRLAYVLYTSGSTGRPKGVGVSHRSALFFLDAMTKRLGWSAETAALAVTTLSFDIALLERWGPLLVGGSSQVASADEVADGAALARRVGTSAPTALQGTPATWRLLREAGWEGAASLQALTGGEALPVELARWISERTGEVWNLYGPTETTVWSTARRLERADLAASRDGRGVVELGEPLGATRLAVLDGRGRAVPVGVWGELAIGGPGVARGYERRGAETALRFVPDPFDAEPGARLYRTGDVCRLRAGGGLEYGGRRDGQIKLRGYRIETGEVEAQLAEAPGVTAAAVVAVDEALVAFAVAGDAFDGESLRAGLRAALPAYMVPQRIEAIEALPLTPNGKIDRRALASEARSRAGGARAHVAPRNETERVLAAIFGEVLGRERVGVEAGFFELGGHSLLATGVAVRIRERLGVELPLRALFEAPTVAALAARIDQGAASQAVPIRAVPADERPDELPLSHAQERLWFLDQLNPGDASYAIPLTLRLDGPLDLDAVGAALRQIVERHEVLRTTFPGADGRPQQRVHGPDSGVARAASSLAELDLSALAEAERDAALRTRVAAFAREPFDLAAGPLLRTTLLRLGPREHVVALVLHHIVGDGWSAGVLARELTALYAAHVAGAPSPLAPLELQYADWALHERAVLDDAAVASELEHWRQTLAGTPPRLLAPDRSDEPRASEAAFAVDGAVLDRLETLALQREASLFMVCLAAFQLLLGREGETDDVVVGTDVAHRTHGATEKLIGFFVNVLPLRTRLGGAATFAALVDRVRATCLEAFEHQDVPFARVAGALGERRDDGRTPLVQVLFVFQNLPPVRLQLGDLAAEALELAEPTTKFDVAFFFRRTETGLAGTWRYDAGRFSPERIERLARRFERLLATVGAAPETELDALDLRTEAERHRESERSSRRAASRRSRLRRASARSVAAAASAPVRAGAPIEGRSGDAESSPWCVEAVGTDADLVAWARTERAAVDDALKQRGAVLFRGGPFHDGPAFEALGRALVDELYGEYGDLPRSGVSGRVYASTPYPADRSIRFHSESSHLTSWPTRILFGCVVAAETQGETPLADGRVVLARLPDDVRERFATLGLRYTRTFTQGLDVRWQDFFRTESRDEVERRCAETETELLWDADGTLRIADRRAAIAPHPDHGWPVWFNQIALHHPRYLDTGVREALLAKYGLERLPRNVTFGDGSTIDERDLAAVDRAYEEARVQFPWRRGDVLLLDNERVAHGRNPFTGERRIIVGMGRMRTPAGIAGEGR